jgi:hypothetical protein
VWHKWREAQPETLPKAPAKIEATGVRCLDVRGEVFSVENVVSLFRETIATPEEGSWSREVPIL